MAERQLSVCLNEKASVVTSRPMALSLLARNRFINDFKISSDKENRPAGVLNSLGRLHARLDRHLRFSMLFSLA